MLQMSRDIRDAFRALRTAPLVSAVAILSLALGIGANTAIFSILDSLLLKPLPVLEPERLLTLGSNQSDEDATVSYPVWKEIRVRGLVSEGFVWGSDRLGTVASSGETTALETIWASGNFFDVLGIRAFAGRTFDAADDRRGGGADGPVAVISYRFWHRRFGAAPDAIGRTLTIDRVPFTIVGVTPPSFFGVNVGSSFDVALPLETEPLLGRLPSRLTGATNTWLHVMARLPEGQSLDAATAALQAAQPAIRAATMPPFRRAEDRERYFRAPWVAKSGATGSSGLRTRYGPALVTLLVIVGLVLLVACANIANLQLARTAARRHEFSVRIALGASRLRIARQLLAESLVLSVVGAVLGFALAYWGSRLLVAQLSTWASTAFLDLTPDWRVLAVTSAVTVTTAILFGSVPAFRAARVQPIDDLKRTSRGATAGAALGVGGALVSVQVALSLILVVAAGLFLRSFTALAYRDLGFDRSRVLVAVVDARRTVVPAGGRAALYERVRAAAAAVNGVESAATSMATPLGSAGIRFTPEITAPGNPAFGGKDVRILTNPVSPDWFRTFGTQLLAGRDFTARDTATASKVIIVNQAFARRYFGGANPTGGTLIEVAGDDRQPLEIVGLVEDAAFASVRDPVDPTLYRPFTQGVEEELLERFPSVSISVRPVARLQPAHLTSTLAAAIRSVDGNLSVSFQTVTEQLSHFYIRERLLALLSAFFGTLALLLAALGLYGVTAYSVNRRRPEIGIRMALGATARSIVRLVLGRVVLLTAVGITAGAIFAFWALRFVRTLLFGVEAEDPVTFAAAAMTIALVGTVAALLPALRAGRIDPAAVVRDG